MKAPFIQCMTHVRTAPGTFRYDASGKASPAPTIYIKRSCLAPPRLAAFG